MVGEQFNHSQGQTETSEGTAEQRAGEHKPHDGEHKTPSAGEIRDGVIEQAEAQKDNTAHRVERAADTVRDAAHSMRDQEPWLSDLVERGANELTRLADALRTTDFRTLLTQAQDFGRRQPVLMAGAGFALGFAMTRATMVGMAAPTDRQGVDTADLSNRAMTPNDTVGNYPPSSEADPATMSATGGLRRDH